MQSSVSASVWGHSRHIAAVIRTNWRARVTDSASAANVAAACRSMGQVERAEPSSARSAGERPARGRPAGERPVAGSSAAGRSAAERSVGWKPAEGGFSCGWSVGGHAEAKRFGKKAGGGAGAGSGASSVRSGPRPGLCVLLCIVRPLPGGTGGGDPPFAVTYPLYPARPRRTGRSGDPELSGHTGRARTRADRPGRLPERRGRPLNDGGPGRVGRRSNQGAALPPTRRTLVVMVITGPGGLPGEPGPPDRDNLRDGHAACHAAVCSP